MEAETRPPLTPLQPDCLVAFGDLLLALAGTLDRREHLLLLRDVFEQAIRRVVPVRTAQLRDLRWSRRSDGTPGAASIALDVHGAGVLEATFDPGAPLGDCDLQALDLATHVGALVLEIERLRRQLVSAGLLTFNQQKDPADVAPLIGSTEAMQALRATIERAAGTEFTILIEGETGVGKALVARHIHEASGRRTGSFVVINRTTLTDATVQTADRGTLFVEDVSALTAAEQATFLRVVERAGDVDVRVMAATNHPLPALVQQHAFRSDLFYALIGVNIRVPALRERPDDIPELARHFLARHQGTRRLELSGAATEVLRSYDWPGNVRELERVIEGAVTFAASDTIGIDDLTSLVGGPYVTTLGPSFKEQDTLRTWTRRYARLVLADCGGNKRQAALRLGISYHTLQAYVRNSGSRDESQQPIDPMVEVRQVVISGD
jgi:DNA-binding NtrC family response regulator